MSTGSNNSAEILKLVKSINEELDNVNKCILDNLGKVSTNIDTVLTKVESIDVISAELESLKKQVMQLAATAATRGAKGAAAKKAAPVEVKAKKMDFKEWFTTNYPSHKSKFLEMLDEDSTEMFNKFKETDKYKSTKGNANIIKVESEYIYSTILENDDIKNKFVELHKNGIEAE